MAKCICCNKELDYNKDGTKYCLSCSLHTKELRAQIGRLKIALRLAREKRDDLKSELSEARSKTPS